MKIQSTLAFAVAAFAFGAAFASPTTPLAAQPVQGTPLERLEAVEKRLTELETQLAGLKSAKPGAVEKGPVDDKALADVDKQLQSVMAYLSAQSEAAKRLDEQLKVSAEQGFTFGINPDSRVTMLAGFGEFTTTLQKDVPTARKAGAAEVAAQKR